MNNSYVLIVLCLLLLSSCTVDRPHSYRPDEGYVSDAATAIRIAEAVLISIYGEEQIRSELPLKAILKNGVWLVEGSTPPYVLGHQFKGGVAVAEIAKEDGRIIRVSHGE
jgi:hypothetical protein